MRFEETTRRQTTAAPHAPCIPAKDLSLVIDHFSLINESGRAGRCDLGATRDGAKSAAEYAKVKAGCGSLSA